MRPTITGKPLNKAVQTGAAASVAQVPTKTAPTQSVGRARPKAPDDFLDQVVDVKNLKGVVVFTGTRREWCRWARAREDAEREAVGLTARVASRRKSSRT